MIKIGFMSTHFSIATAVLALILVGTSCPAIAQNNAIVTTDKQVDPVAHNTWTNGAVMPSGAWCSMAALLKNEIYVLGGENVENVLTSATQIYNPVTNTWSTGTSLPTTLCGGVAAVVKNVLYVISGSADGKTCTNAVWAYTPKTETWSAKAAIPTARCDGGAVVEKNIIYVIGGVVGNSRLDTVESYNPVTNTWAEEAPLLVGKSEPSIGLVGTTIVAADGYTSSEDTGDNEGYSAITNTWTTFHPDPTPRNTGCGGGIGGYMYVIGGYPGGGPGTPAYSLNESFNVKKNAWKTLAPIPQAAMFPASAVYKGKLYCFGGTSTYQGTVLNNVQIYQP